MNRLDLQKLAQQYFIADAGLGLANLVRKIQLAEGHADCFLTDKSDCVEWRCRWRMECLAPGSGTMRAAAATRPERSTGSSGND